MLRQHQQRRGRLRIITGSLVMLFVIVTVSDRTGALGGTLFTGGAAASKPAVRLTPPFPTAESTGVGFGASLRPWPGPLNTNAVPAPTETINGMSCKIFTGYLVSLSGGSYLYVDSPCVVFRNSRFQTSGVVSNGSAIVQQGGSNKYLGIAWCDFDGGPSHQRGLQGDMADMVVTSSNFTRFGQAGIEMNNRSGTASLTVQDSYFAEVPGWPQPDHVDGIQVGAGENVTIHHNTVLVPQYGGSQGDTGYVSNSVLGLWAELGNVTGTVMVDGNLLAGGGFAVYLEQKDPDAWLGPVWVLNNVFDQRFGPNGGIWGPLYPQGLPAQLTWSGNVWSGGAPLSLSDALSYG
jgi:hypothetical protein